MSAIKALRQRTADLTRLNDLYNSPNKGHLPSEFYERHTAIYTEWCKPSLRRYLRTYSPYAGRNLAKELDETENDIIFIFSLFPQTYNQYLKAVQAITKCRRYHKPWLSDRYEFRSKIKTPKKYEQFL
jgi:hypothetical protein